MKKKARGSRIKVRRVMVLLPPLLSRTARTFQLPCPKKRKRREQIATSPTSSTSSSFSLNLFFRFQSKQKIKQPFNGGSLSNMTLFIRFPFHNYSNGVYLYPYCNLPYKQRFCFLCCWNILPLLQKQK